MKKLYIEPDLELLGVNFNTILNSQALSDPETSGSDGEEFVGEV